MHLLDTKGLVSTMTMTAPKAKVHRSNLYVREPHVSSNQKENAAFHQTMKAEQELLDAGVDQATASALTYGILYRTSGIELEAARNEFPKSTRKRYEDFAHAVIAYRDWIENCTHTT